MASKGIKKGFRILLYALAVLIVLPVSAYFSLQSPGVQTWLTNSIAGYFSSKWGTEVRIDGVDIEFFTKVVLEGVYVEDQHRDTLLYADELKLDISTFDTDSSKLFIRDIILQDATVKLKWYNGDSALNFQFIIDEFASTDTTSSTDSTKWDIGIGGITLDNIRLAYRIESDTAHLKGINFSDLLATSVNGKISDVRFDSDTTRFVVDNLSLKEKSGFILKEFHADASISPVIMQMNAMKIFTNNSHIIANISFRYKSLSDFNDFIDNVKMKAQFSSSNIEMEDVAYFSKELYGLRKKIFLNGDVSGKVSDLRGKNILLVIGDETSFLGNFTMTGLPDFNQTFMSFDAKELRTSKDGLEKIPLPPFDKDNSLKIPDDISLFGIMKFKGNFSGFYNDFVAYGDFNTALGKLTTDISLKQDSASGRVSYHGKLACTDFNFGRFIKDEKNFGKLTMKVNVDGKGLKAENVNTKADGSIQSFYFNGYTYQGIEIKASLAKNIFDGELTVNDENLALDFNGTMDFRKSPTVIDFDSEIRKANIAKLNFVKSDEFAGITAKIHMDGVGNNVDDVTGTIRLDNVVYLKNMEVFDFKDLEFSVDEDNGIKTVHLDSDIANAKIYGKFKPKDIVPSMIDFLGDYLPSVFSNSASSGISGSTTNKSKAKKEFNEDFSFSMQINKPDVVTMAFLPTIDIADSSLFSGRYNAEKNDFSFDASFSSVSIQKYELRNCNLKGATAGNKLSFTTDCHRLLLSDSVWIDNIHVDSEAAKDTLGFNLLWKNSTAEKYEGKIPGYIAFAGKNKMKFKLHPSEITIADSTWRIDAGNEVAIDSSSISIRSVDFFSGKQHVKLEGNISEVKEDQLYLIFSSFSLANMNSLLKGTGFSVNGTISGNTSVSNFYDKPIFGSSIDIQNMKVNKQVIGDGNLVCVFDRKKDVMNFNGGFKRDLGDVRFAGNYFPFRDTSSLQVDAGVNYFNLEFFEPFIKSNIESLKGTASAELRITGTPQVPILNGTIKTKVDNLHVNYLGTNYHFEGDISVDPNSFDFANLTVYDSNNNRADIVNGKIFHDNFRNFQLDCDMNADKFLCLNTTEKDNSIYYGKFFATGIMNVFGFFDNINLSATVKTDKAKNLLGKNEYTQLFIPLSGSDEVGENNFITFVSSDTSLKIKPVKYKVNTTGFTMDFKLEATEDAQVQLIFDEKVGDLIKATGKGNIEMIINEFGDFRMYGDYTVNDGDYLFTLKNVVNKKFRLEKGGTIHWSGNPEEAEIDMSAVYELRTSLSPLFLEHEQTENEAIKKRYPVDCIMNLSGKLLEPNITFDIQLPTVDDFTRQQAYDKFRNSENEMNQQVFSLLFTNSFITPPDIKSQQTQENTGPGAGAVTSTELLSNQLSNWLSQISNEFDVGVHYRPGDEINKDEVELALSTQLFNDKLSIDGTVANNANNTSQNTSNIVGDINMEYKLTDDGKWKAKAYNKANEGDVLNTEKGNYTQGVGIFYREEFDTVKELYRRFLSKFKT